MPDISDIDLLQDYNRNASEPAFAEVVRRHINLVYSTALRHAGIPAHAEEIAQAVFVILARKAAALRPALFLRHGFMRRPGSRLSVSSVANAGASFASRRPICNRPFKNMPTSTWSEFAPLLDEAVARLGKKDRDAVVLRFFKEKNLSEVAQALNVTEGAAQVRVHRALEKLRGFFSKRGVVSTTAIIANEISANSVQAAPAGLAKTISAVAVVKGATASTSTLTLIKGALKIMAWTKMKTTVAATAIVMLAAAGTTTVVVRQIAADHQNDYWRVGSSDPKYLSALPYRTLILPTRAGRYPPGLGVLSFDGRAYGVDYSIEDMLRWAFFKPDANADSYMFSSVRTSRHETSKQGIRFLLEFAHRSERSFTG